MVNDHANERAHYDRRIHRHHRAVALSFGYVVAKQFVNPAHKLLKKHLRQLVSLGALRATANVETRDRIRGDRARRLPVAQKPCGRLFPESASANHCLGIHRIARNKPCDREGGIQFLLGSESDEKTIASDTPAACAISLVVLRQTLFERRDSPPHGGLQAPLFRRHARPIRHRCARFYCCLLTQK